MNFRINFSKLLRETRPVKIEQQYKFLEHICTKTAPDNAMVIYFFALIQKKFKGKVSNELKQRIKKRVSGSEYWIERFDNFGLSQDDVINEKFPGFVETGGMPMNYEGKTDRFLFPTQTIV